MGRVGPDEIAGVARFRWGTGAGFLFVVEVGQVNLWHWADLLGGPDCRPAADVLVCGGTNTTST
jgi:hypothetical protein